MKMTNKETSNLLFASVVRALLGEIPFSLRKFTFEDKNSTIIIRAYFDGEISEDDEESMQCVGTEIIADFHHTHKIRVETIRYDVPLPLNNVPGIAVYQRKE